MNRLLIVAAHPDDEVLGAGGTIARVRKHGGKVHVLYLCENHVRHGRDAHVARTQITNALETLGSGIGMTLVGLSDQSLDTYPMNLTIRHVRAAVESFGPDVIITHSREDLNRDHRAAQEATAVAARSHISRAEIWEMFVPSASDVSGWMSMQPNVMVEISEEELNKKTAALQCYTDEVQQVGPRSVETLRAWAMAWGASAGRKYVEPFRLARKFV